MTAAAVAEADAEAAAETAAAADDEDCEDSIEWVGDSLSAGAAVVVAAVAPCT